MSSVFFFSLIAPYLLYDTRINLSKIVCLCVGCSYFSSTNYAKMKLQCRLCSMIFLCVKLWSRLLLKYTYCSFKKHICTSSSKPYTHVIVTRNIFPAVGAKINIRGKGKKCWTNRLKVTWINRKILGIPWEIPGLAGRYLDYLRDTWNSWEIPWLTERLLGLAAWLPGLAERYLD